MQINHNESLNSNSFLHKNKTLICKNMNHSVKMTQSMINFTNNTKKSQNRTSDKLLSKKTWND